MEVIVGTKVIIRAVKQRKNLYYVQGSTVYAEVFAVSSKEEISKLWHYRLGQMSERGLAVLC